MGAAMTAAPSPAAASVVDDVDTLSTLIDVNPIPTVGGMSWSSPPMDCWFCGSLTASAMALTATPPCVASSIIFVWSTEKI